MSDTPKFNPGRLSFSIRDLFWFTAVVAVVLWAFYARPVTPGRYELIKGNEALGQTFLLDTATGQCWRLMLTESGPIAHRRRH